MKNRAGHRCTRLEEAKVRPLPELALRKRWVCVVGEEPYDLLSPLVLHVSLVVTLTATYTPPLSDMSQPLLDLTLGSLISLTCFVLVTAWSRDLSSPTKLPLSMLWLLRPRKQPPRMTPGHPRVILGSFWGHPRVILGSS